MALYPKAIATDGYVANNKWPLSIATDGYLTEVVIFTINLPSRTGFTQLIPINERELPRVEAMILAEDEEIMLILEMFMMRWNLKRK